jgi:hypothetical protein
VNPSGSLVLLFLIVPLLFLATRHVYVYKVTLRFVYFGRRGICTSDPRSGLGEPPPLESSSAMMSASLKIMVPMRLRPFYAGWGCDRYCLKYPCPRPGVYYAHGRRFVIRPRLVLWVHGSSPSREVSRATLDTSHNSSRCAGGTIPSTKPHIYVLSTKA